MDWLRWQEWVGFLAVALNVGGNLLLTRKDARGWAVRLVCNVAQLAYAILIASMSLSVNALVFALINVVGVVRWRRGRGHEDTCGVLKWPRIRPCNCGRFS